MRIVDVMLSFPAFILALAVTVMLGNKVGYVIAALAVAYTPFFVRLTRGEVLKIRDSEYADAARVVGNPAWRVAFVTSSLTPWRLQSCSPRSCSAGRSSTPRRSASSASGSSRRPREWGMMVADGAQNIDSGEWWTWVFPGATILVVVLAFNWIGDGLRNLFRSA